MRDTDAQQLRPPSLPNRLLSIQEAAEYLNVPMRWVQDAVQQRRIRCTRIGKHVRFTREHLDELIDAGEQAVLKPRHAGMPQIGVSRRSRI
jgi:excisionase family DNA binding protein